MTSFPLEKDPQREAELSKYEAPTASRQYILQVLEHLKQPAELEELIEAFGLSDEEAINKLTYRLKAMERAGQILFDRKQRYGLVEHMNVHLGVVLAHADGFGFVKMDKGGDDWYLSPRDMKPLLPNDRVLVTVKGVNRKGRIEASVARIIEEGNKNIVGQYHEQDGLKYVVPEDKRINFEIQLDATSTLKAKLGELVLVELLQRPTRYNPAKGLMIEILGEPMAPGMEIAIALRSFDLPFVWPKAVEEECANLHAEVMKADIKGRRDLTQLPLVTIDGEDARDFDDAVFCEKKATGGWRLWVAIADVSHYVKPDSALDLEGQNRGNSVYFPGEVIPMLPEILSNGLCSLKPDVHRLAMICEMTVSQQGNLSGYQFYPAVIRSHARLTYTQVWQYLSKPEQLPKDFLGKNHQRLIEPLNEIYRLFHALSKARYQRGCIDFDTVETGFIFSADRKIESIRPIYRNDVHKIIEECMILANVASARFLVKLKAQGVFRNHQGPTQKKLDTLRGYLGQLGLSLSGGEKPTPKDFEHLLESIKERVDVEQIQLMMLRSLSQAQYETENEGHFGLALAGYSHFTSPIRRYPDLILHRLIKYQLVQQGSKDRGVESGYQYSPEKLTQLTSQCSLTERRADEATRDVSDWLKCEYMQHKIGEKYAGQVASVTGFGLFVRLDEIYIEGLLHISALSRDYYRFDATSQSLIGERTGQRFGIGDKMTIRVARVSLEDRKIDFELVSLDASYRMENKNSKQNKGRANQNSAKSEKAPAKKSRKNSSSKKSKTRISEKPSKVARKSTKAKKASNNNFKPKRSKK